MAPTESHTTDLITCERCERTTTDPDLWDPEADTGRIFCNRCWDDRDKPRFPDDPDVYLPLHASIGWLVAVVRRLHPDLLASEAALAERHGHHGIARQLRAWGDVNVPIVEALQ